MVNLKFKKKFREKEIFHSIMNTSQYYDCQSYFEGIDFDDITLKKQNDLKFCGMCSKQTKKKDDYCKIF